MNPQNRRDLLLTPEQEKTFSDHLWLIKRVVKWYGALCSRFYFDDFRQHCRVELTKAVLNAGNKNGHTGSFLWLNVRDAARSFLFGRRRFGYATLREAEKRELPDDKVVNEETGETRFERAEAKVADLQYQREQAQRADDRLAQVAIVVVATWIVVSRILRGKEPVRTSAPSGPNLENPT